MQRSIAASLVSLRSSDALDLRLNVFKYRARSMSLNCSSETNAIDSNTVSIKYIVGGWLTLIFCLFGILNNIFTVIVLLHPRMRNSSTHVYLMALSACNIFLLAGLMINYSLKSIASYPELLAYLRQPDSTNRNALLANAYEQFYARAAPFTTPFLSMLLLCSTYFTVLVSGDRYFLICWPSVAEKIRTRPMALRLVLLVFVLVNIYVIPHWFEYRTAPSLVGASSSLTNLTLNATRNISRRAVREQRLVELGYTRLGAHKVYLSIYRMYLNIPVTFVIPFTLLALCNGSVIHQLLLIKKKKKRLGHRMKADIRITTMLIVIVLTFMLCRSINLGVNLSVHISPCLNKNSLQRINAFANLLIAFNGFVNFFLFVVFGQRFREMVLYIFFRRGHHPFFSPLEGMSAYRSGAGGGTPTTDPLRRQSRRFSTNESDLWAAISRRRSSATMAVLYNPSDNRPRSISHSITNTSHLGIPNYTNGGEHVHISTSSINIGDSPFPNSSYQELDSHHPTPTMGNTLVVPTNERVRTPSPSCMKRRADDLTPTMTHHVKFV